MLKGGFRYALVRRIIPSSSRVRLLGIGKFMESFTRANRQIGTRALVPIGGSAHARVAVVILLLQVAVLGQPANNRIETIAAALRNREFDSALQLLQPALQASPKNPQ